VAYAPLPAVKSASGRREPVRATAPARNRGCRTPSRPRHSGNASWLSGSSVIPLTSLPVVVVLEDRHGQANARTMRVPDSRVEIDRALRELIQLVEVIAQRQLEAVPQPAVGQLGRDRVELAERLAARSAS